jgi:hypothetical protein
LNVLYLVPDEDMLCALPLDSIDDFAFSDFLHSRTLASSSPCGAGDLAG